MRHANKHQPPTTTTTTNHPTGPFMYKGKYHLFYQHLPEGCEWAFGLVWGHAVSADLVQWHHLPHALEPTPGALDADGARAHQRVWRAC